MDNAKLEFLKKHYAFEEWFGRNTLDENLLVWKFFPGESEIPGWVPQRVQLIVAPAPASEDGPADDAMKESSSPRPSLVQSLWQSGGAGDEEALLRVDSFECASREAAQEYLLRALGEFQSPDLVETSDVGGDVAFTFGGGASVLFARGNMVFVLRNGGRKVIKLSGIAGSLDSALISKPESEKREIDLTGKMGKEDGGASLDAEISSVETGSGQWYKFFSPGELRLENGTPVLAPTVTGSNKVEIFTVQTYRK